MNEQPRWTLSYNQQRVVYNGDEQDVVRWFGAGGVDGKGVPGAGGIGRVGEAMMAAANSAYSVWYGDTPRVTLEVEGYVFELIRFRGLADHPDDSDRSAA